jgi:hypothetical protein
MPGQDSFQFDPVPNYIKPTHQFGRTFGDEFHAPSDDELLASYAAFTQRGVTLAGGQGVLPTGCALAQHTASKLYFVADPKASDGRQNVLGLLRDARDTGGNGGTFTAQGITGFTFTAATGGQPSFSASPAGVVAQNCLGNLVIRGMVNLSLVSGQDVYSLLPTVAAGGGQPPVTGPNGIGSMAIASGAQAPGVVTQLQARADQVNFILIF